jgi:hypothetical protein
MPMHGGVTRRWLLRSLTVVFEESGDGLVRGALDLAVEVVFVPGHERPVIEPGLVCRVAMADVCPRGQLRLLLQAQQLGASDASSSACCGEKPRKASTASRRSA